MKAHPIIDGSYRWIPVLVSALVLVIAQVALLHEYAGIEYLPAVIDGVETM